MILESTIKAIIADEGLKDSTALTVLLNILDENAFSDAQRQYIVEQFSSAANPSGAL